MLSPGETLGCWSLQDWLTCPSCSIQPLEGSRGPGLAAAPGLLQPPPSEPFSAASYQQPTLAPVGAEAAEWGGGHKFGVFQSVLLLLNCSFHSPLSLLLVPFPPLQIFPEDESREVGVGWAWKLSTSVKELDFTLRAMESSPKYLICVFRKVPLAIGKQKAQTRSCFNGPGGRGVREEPVRQ